MKSPLDFTWAFPEFDGVQLVRVEEFLQFTQDSSRVNLEGVDIAIEDFLGHMDGVSYDDNLGDVIKGVGLVYTASDSKQLRFSCSYEGHIMNCFDKWLICRVDM